MATNTVQPDGSQQAVVDTDTNGASITEQYAKRVIAAVVNPYNRSFDETVADEIANAHVKYIKVLPDPAIDGDYRVLATVRGVDTISNRRETAVVDFFIGQFGACKEKDGETHIRFSGFKSTGDDGGVSIQYDENGVVQSEDGLKCVFELRIEGDDSECE